LCADHRQQRHIWPERGPEKLAGEQDEQGDLGAGELRTEQEQDRLSPKRHDDKRRKRQSAKK